MNFTGDNQSSKNSGIIPCLEPCDGEITSNIKNLVYAVLENGKDFEKHILAAEKGNPAYGFLADCCNEGFYFYRWTLHCLGDCLRPELVGSIIDSHRRYILSCFPGALDLTTESYADFDRMLASIDGSKHSIRLFRGWVLKHAHSSISIGTSVERFISQIIHTPDGYNKSLHVLYGLNDVLFNASSENMVGPYTKLLVSTGDTSLADRRVDILQCLFKTLGYCLHATFTTAVDDVGRGKCSKIIELWKSKNFITDEQQQSLLASMLSGVPDDRYTSNICIKSPYAPLQFKYHDHTVLTPSLQYSIPAPLPPPRPFLNPESFINNNQQGQGFPSFPFTNHPGGPISFPPPPVPMVFYPPPPHSGVLPAPMHNIMPRGPMPSFHSPVLPGSMPFNMNPLQNYSLPQASLLTPFIDMSKLPVGGVSNIAKFAVKSGHKKYSPIDVASMMLPSVPHVEPGRLEVRVNDYYKKLNDAMLEIDRIAAKRLRKEVKVDRTLRYGEEASVDSRGNNLENQENDDNSAYYGPASGKGLGWK